MLFTFSNKGLFLCLRMTNGIKRHMQKLGHDVLPYVSEFRRSERNNNFLQKHFEKNNIT